MAKMCYFYINMDPYQILNAESVRFKADSFGLLLPVSAWQKSRICPILQSPYLIQNVLNLKQPMTTVCKYIDWKKKIYKVNMVIMKNKTCTL